MEVSIIDFLRNSTHGTPRNQLAFLADCATIQSQNDINLIR